MSNLKPQTDNLTMNQPHRGNMLLYVRPSRTLGTRSSFAVVVQPSPTGDLLCLGFLVNWARLACLSKQILCTDIDRFDLSPLVSGVSLLCSFT